MQGFEYSENDPSKYFGQKILSASINDNRLKLALSNGKNIEIWDDGQSCCEVRYIQTDDDVSDLVGNVLTRIKTKEAPNVSDEDTEVHEIVFVEIGTDKSSITLVSHNEHNGYYGGFDLTITESV